MNDHLHNQNSLPDQLVGIWRRRKWLLIFAFLLVFPAGVALVVALPPLYRASTTLLLGEGDISAALVNANTGESVAARLDVINKAILSRARLQDLITRFDLYPQLRATTPTEAVIERLRRDIGINQEVAMSPNGVQYPTVTLMLSYQNRDPELAARVANELGTLYGQENEARVEDRNARTTEFLSMQLDEANQRLAAQETLIRNFMDEHLKELPQQQSLSLTTLERLNTEIRLNNEKQIQLMNQRDGMVAGSNAIGMLSSSRITNTSGMTNLEVLRMQLAELSNQYTERHPEIQRLKKAIADLEAQPESRSDTSETSGASASHPGLSPISRELALLEQQQAALRANLAEVQARIESTPGIAQELLELNRDYDVIREEQTTLLKRYNEARLAESVEQHANQQFQVLEAALPPLVPVAPQRGRIIVMGFVMSLMFAAAVVFIREQFDTSFHTLEDVRAFTRLPVLGSIGRIENPRARVQQGLRGTVFALGAAACVAALVFIAYKIGQDGEQIVWLLAGRSI
jgi:polysaccharide biosynthesis transport protein